MSRPRNQAKWEEISRLRGIGTTQQDISRMVGMDLSSVRYVLQHVGTPYQAQLAARRAEWKKLYEEEHYTMAKIGRLFGRDRTVVLRELQRAGVPTRPYGQNKRPVTSCRKPSPRLIKFAPPRSLRPYEPANPLVIQRMMDISLRIERRSRGMLA